MRSMLRTRATAMRPSSRRTHVVQEDSEEQGMDVDENNSTDDEEDNIRADIEAALEDVNFAGNFYHANVLEKAPNPCLYIDGPGLVGLPLSKRDAKAIVSCATLAPFGHGERTVIDKDVRDTWEIEPAKITFKNPEWIKYVDGVLCREICKALGVSIGKSPPKMELYKLLLYETGSHFLPHQDTQKANGMFATVVILLPSKYTGGQVVVSHASMTKFIDLAQNSLLSTAVLAWYTDVKHEVKPVTSGYRLALSYNLIHVAPPQVPLPTLPGMVHAMARVRRVLKKWREERYEKLPKIPLLAYLLNHEYSESDLKKGMQALKGPDAHRVRALRDVAEEEGYLTNLGRLDHSISGCADDEGGYHGRRSCAYSDEYDDESPESAPDMLEVCHTYTRIKGLVDLNGVPLPSLETIALDDENLVQRDPFDNKKPDKKEYEGYMGNGAGELQYWYYRTVFVLMHRDDVDDICFSVKGVPYAFQKLTTLGAQTATVPTTDMRLWATRLVSTINKLDKDQTIKLLDLALLWRDAEMFQEIIRSPVSSLGTVKLKTLLKALKIFSFEVTKSSFELLLSRSTQFSTKINLIYSIRDKASGKKTSGIHAWCDKEAHKILSSYAQADVTDIPTIISIGELAGWQTFFTVLLPRLFKLPNSYYFWVAFIKTVRESRQSILDSILLSPSTPSAEAASLPGVQHSLPSGSTSTVVNAYMSALGISPGDKNIVDALIHKALKTVAKQWSSVSHIIEIIDLAITVDNLKVVQALFVDIIKSPGNSSTKFVQLYTPLIPRLCALLSSKKVDLLSAPFVDLFHNLISTYLRDILGKTGQSANVRLRKIGCGCRDCGLLDHFILNPRLTTQIFRLAQARRTHLEQQLAKASDLCTFVTIKSGSPHGVQVTRRPEVIQASMWRHKQQEAKKFLTLIGPDATISNIMGQQYADVVAAINGAAWFGTEQKGAATNATSAASTTGSQVAKKRASTAASNSTTGPVASKKRKHPGH